MTDLHIHTRISHDSKESAENYILAAKRLGADCLGFSEHCDYDVFLDGGADKCPLPNFDEYFKEVSALSAKYPEIKILKGIELGYARDAVNYYNGLLSERNFDYAILSVHTLKGKGDCYFPAFYSGLTKKQSYGEYFKAVLESVRSEINYNIVGHIGYIARYAPFEDKRIVYAEFSEILDEILREIIARGKCLEINTSVKGLDDISIPNAEILERYIALGGKNFSLGSDSHTVERFMKNFGAVKEFLLARGVTQTCRFQAGKLLKENL